MTTWLALLLLVISDCAGSMLLVQGMQQVGEVKTTRISELWRLGQRVLTTPRLLVGVANLAIAFFMLIYLLSSADISFVIPATALTEPVNMLGSRFILQEKVVPLRWLSIVLIFLGVTLISLN